MWLPALPLLVLAVAPPGTPGPPPRSPPLPAVEADAPDVQRARALFASAEQLFAQRKYAAAVVKFEEAQALRPHPSVLFNIARCREQLGEVPAALRGYRAYLRQTRAEDAELRRLVAQLERRLRERGVQQLTVYATPAAAQVAINGRQLGPAPATTELPEGDHELLVSVDGFQPERRRFRHQLGQAEDLVVVLTPIPGAPGAVTAPPLPVPPKRTPPPGEPQVKWRGFSSAGGTWQGTSGTGHAWRSDSTVDMQGEQQAPRPGEESPGPGDSP